MTQKLPIFPLNTVLFPGSPIQLHIFEERYRLMVARCLEQHAPFGVVLIRSGSEVSPDDPWVREQVERAGGGDEELSALRQQLGGETVPYAVGTSAQISSGESTRLPDGRYYLVAMGQKRFRIQYLTQRRPYMVASSSAATGTRCGRRRGRWRRRRSRRHPKPGSAPAANRTGCSYPPLWRATTPGSSRTGASTAAGAGVRRTTTTAASSP
jgi:hypothetical protein